MIQPHDHTPPPRETAAHRHVSASDERRLRRHGAPRLRHGATTGSPRSHHVYMGSRSAVMVGRVTELRLLQEASTLAEAGHTQVVAVTGEAGIGKTRLVREFAAGLPEETVVAFGHAVPLSEGTVPYGVAADLLRWLVRRVGAEAVRAVLAERARFLAPLVPNLGKGAADPVDRLALFAATQDLLVELAGETLVVLVVEDLHWSDPASTDLVNFWARTITQGRLLLVVTSRDVGEDGTIVDRLREMARL